MPAIIAQITRSRKVLLLEMLVVQPNQSGSTEDSPPQRPSSPVLPSWRDPNHPTGHDRFRQLFRDHWDWWCEQRLEDEVPPDQRTNVRKIVERMMLCRDVNAGYARYICPGCGNTAMLFVFSAAILCVVSFVAGLGHDLRRMELDNGIVS
jgi:hypothetical protein